RCDNFSAWGGIEKLNTRVAEWEQYFPSPPEPHLPTCSPPCHPLNRITLSLFNSKIIIRVSFCAFKQLIVVCHYAEKTFLNSIIILI
ncbi:MAG: hypothetical protein O4805_07080, partial [Trichodesmium sp. St16_bin2-tuft]|nr:hypothetical protein [Trichodesmium sp. St16_bin2-tuft]MDE5109969.1 hypothetical protein [Trichodesmium sp. St7_bin2_1]